MTDLNKQRQARPQWLKVKAPGGESFAKIKTMLRDKSLHTVCEEAHCPNISECWSCGTATFMILGDICSRNCRFCAVGTGKLLPPNPKEPDAIADSIKSMKLKHAVITSVTRDDLPDGGSEHWAKVISAVHDKNPKTSVESLIPDFNNIDKQLEVVFAEKPEILNHNVETVPELYDIARPQANYKASLEVLRKAKDFGLKTKTGIMVGLGETKEQLLEVFNDLRKIDVKILTLGQYLQPTKQHLPVAKYVHPDEFDEYKTIGLEMGFSYVESAPLVRSSYHAEKQI